MKVEDLSIGSITATVEFALDALAMKDRPGFRSGICPNHWMPGRAYTCLGRLEFVDREWLRPGERCNAKGWFILAEQDLPSFVPGLVWDVGEGPRIVGTCRLLSVDGPFEPLPTSRQWAEAGSPER